MSPKDLCTIGFIDRLADAGVRVLKIEGRARGPEYVATVVGAYDRALRALCDGTYGAALVEELTAELRKVFNEDSGTAIISDSGSANGRANTARRPPA